MAQASWITNQPSNPTSHTARQQTNQPTIEPTSQPTTPDNQPARQPTSHTNRTATRPTSQSTSQRNAARGLPHAQLSPLVSARGGGACREAWRKGVSLLNTSGPKKEEEEEEVGAFRVPGAPSSPLLDSPLQGWSERAIFPRKTKGGRGSSSPAAPSGAVPVRGGAVPPGPRLPLRTEGAEGRPPLSTFHTEGGQRERSGGEACWRQRLKAGQGHGALTPRRGAARRGGPLPSP
eukprot:7895113-Pyramimonas_sp.AAC.2